ncbi:Aldo/keto reductase [Gymnopus androsaceus JB14]|uniref:Aldo/keto reductase n=1 Tax=Gymnopus androsaceus JB14 TaxID=1447944 RepID=A0A6A4HFL0_9AGAR|nr:Aldo/keto reductase [Gymnopus androsaceus JB14]
MSLPPRKIGDSFVHPIGFGVMGISTWYGEIESDEERLKVLDAAYEEGSNHWDSADCYGDSELLIGKWFAKTGKRKEIFLTSKFGYTPTAPCGKPEYVKSQCAKSLERFGVEYIDLYYQHRPDPTVPIEVTVKAMAELVKEGKVKYIGLSECTAADLRRAAKIHPIAAIQVEYSPFALHIEDEKIAILKTARELGVTVVAYSPLARGLITGRYTSAADFEEGDFRKYLPKFQDKNFPKILDVVKKLEAIGANHKATSSQVTLAWILAQGNDFVVIPGTKKVKYLKENMGGAAVKLTPEEVAAIRKIAEESEIPGERYPEAALATVMVDTPPLQE